MTHDDIIVKIQLLADKVKALKEENRHLKEEKSRLTLTLAETQSRAEEVEGRQTASSANLLMLKQKEELMLAAQEDLQANLDHAKTELEACLQALTEKDAQLREAEHGVSRLSTELHETAHAIDEKNNTIHTLQQKLSTQDEGWQNMIREKDEAIAQFTEELKAAVQKLEAMHSERQSLTTQLDELITHVDGQIEQLKTETNG